MVLSEGEIEQELLDLIAARLGTVGEKVHAGGGVLSNCIGSRRGKPLCWCTCRRREYLPSPSLWWKRGDEWC